MSANHSFTVDSEVLLSEIEFLDDIDWFVDDIREPVHMYNDQSISIINQSCIKSLQNVDISISKITDLCSLTISLIGCHDEQQKLH